MRQNDVLPAPSDPTGRALVEMGIVAAPAGYEPVPWYWDLQNRVVHRRDCPQRGSKAFPWFWAADHCPDQATLLAHIPPHFRPCSHCLG